MQISPFLIYIRTINILGILERIDAIFVIAWIVSSLTKVGGFLYISAESVREVLNKDKNEKVILFIISALLFAITAYISGNYGVIAIRDIKDRLLTSIFIISALIIPIISLIIYFFRKESLGDKTPG